MQIILNKTRRPLKIHLSNGKVLHLGPGREGQIGDADEDRESVKKLVKAGEIEFLGHGSRLATARGGGIPGRSSQRGHHPAYAVKKRGDR